MYNMFYNTSLYLEWHQESASQAIPLEGEVGLGQNSTFWGTGDEVDWLWTNKWCVSSYCRCLKNQGWVCGCLEDPYCASPKKQGWKTRRELVESWCGCCEPVGNRNGWNCISHKLAVTRFTASLQYQVSFCFSFRPGQLQMCLHIFNPHNITPALLSQLKQFCQIWVNYFS